MTAKVVEEAQVEGTAVAGFGFDYEDSQALHLRAKALEIACSGSWQNLNAPLVLKRAEAFRQFIMDGTVPAPE